ncbi:dTMP kinase, partial [Parasphingorhabdus sp.]
TIRELLLTGNDEKWNMRTEALLFAAARSEHCQSLIKPALERGEWVISDRFIDSSRAYQSVSGELDDVQIMSLHQVGSGGLMPDRTFILDIPEKIAAQRANARDRGDSDRIGGRDSEYHQKVMASFRSYATNEPERVHLVDASSSVEEITSKLMQNLSEWLS